MTPRLLFLLLLCHGASAQQSGSVSGLVVSKYDRQPVRKAGVYLTSLSPDRSFAVAVTDASGRFTIPGIPAGRYRLHAVRPGFLSVAYGAGSPRFNGATLVLVAGETRNGVTLQLVPENVLSGTVADPEGDPLPGVQLELYIRRYDRGKPHYLQTGNAVTDSRGHYEISGVAPGEYVVLAQPHFLPTFRTRPVAVAGEAPLPETFAPQFFSGADRLASAAPVTVTASREISAVDFRLNYAPQVALHGSITGIPEGAKTVSVTLQADTLPGGRNNYGSLNVDPANPTFQFPGLGAGGYKLIARAGDRRSVIPLQLNSPDTELNVAIAPGVALSGFVSVEGPNAEALKDVKVSLSPGDYVPSRSLQAEVKAGAFRFEEVPAGIWDIGVNPLPRGAYIKSMSLGDHDVLLDDMVIGPNSKGPLNIIVSTAAPKVEGVLDPPAPATVLAAPTGKLAGVFSFYATVQADEHGRFTFSGLNPGPYRLYAFQEIEPQAWEDAHFLLPFEAQSRAADLKEGATEKLTLPIIGSARP